MVSQLTAVVLSNQFLQEEINVLRDLHLKANLPFPEFELTPVSQTHTRVDCPSDPRNLSALCFTIHQRELQKPIEKTLKDFFDDYE